MDFESVNNYLIRRLKNELSRHLTYHSVEHTLDVIQSCQLLAGHEGVNGPDLILIKTAALFHDAGFIRKYDGHEDVSIELAAEILPHYDYSEKEIEMVASMIIATRIPQQPASLSEKILADADLDYLGRDDLFVISQRLHYELKKINRMSSLRQWHELQLSFLKNHSYFTRSAHRLRDVQKQENIRELEDLLFCK
ncbi:MAG: HD domain-containing protein [Bacteroidales bacterium]|nr:HD domain-containing protein [Bacteroidales bacterium]